MSAALLRRLFARIEGLGFTYYDLVETGQLVNRVTSHLESLRRAVRARDPHHSARGGRYAGLYRRRFRERAVAG